MTGASAMVTFLLTDIEGSTELWERQPAAMGEALAHHDAMAASVVAAGGGRLVKTRGEGDATFSVFDSPAAAVVAATELQSLFANETFPGGIDLRIRIALHTGIAENRAGDQVNDPGASSALQGYAGHYCNVPQEHEPGIVACSFLRSWSG